MTPGCLELNRMMFIFTKCDRFVLLHRMTNELEYFGTILVALNRSAVAIVRPQQTAN